MLKKIAIYLALAGSIITIFGTSFWLNLDSQTLTPWFEHQINNRLPREYSVSIQSAETQLFGLVLSQIQVFEQKREGSLVQVQSVDFSFSLIDLIVFQEVDYKASLYEGVIEGKLAVYPELTLDYKIVNIHPNLVKPIRKTKLIRSRPVINGSGMVSLQQPASARLDILVNNLTLSGESEITHLPFELPATKVEIIEGRFSLVNNKVEIFLKSSGEVKATVDGNILLNRKTLDRSKIDLVINGQLEKDYEANLGFLKDLLVNYKNKSGQLSVKISGNFRKPNFRKI